MEEIYREMYYKLFNEMTDAIEHLKKVQQEAEELYLAHHDTATKNPQLPTDAVVGDGVLDVPSP